MDRQSVYTLSLFGEEQSANGDSTNKQIQKELIAFVLEFHLDGNYIYRYAVVLYGRHKRSADMSQ